MGQRERPPRGIVPGLETSLPLLLNQVANGTCTLEAVVKWMCEGPARCFNIQNKGHLKVGYDAELVLIDKYAKKTVTKDLLHTKSNWSAFEGQELVAWPVSTYVNGHMAFREGDIFDDVKGTVVLLGS